MFKSLLASAAAAFLAASLVTTAAAATEDSKKATALLFETPHLASVPAGTKFVYTDERVPSNEKLLGKGFTDEITVDVESDAAAGKKNVVVHLYTGERARDPQRITEMDGNPMLVVFLDNAVGRFQQFAGGDRAYLKHKFSKSIGDESTLTPVKISYNGSEVDGYRVQVKPFENDPARAKMRGFEVAEFSIVISEKIPGFFAKMVANYANTQKDSPTLVDTMTLKGVGDVK
ncbi:MAG: hypothetical protein IPL91_01365 [Hyphomicrobium sp.]|nr:hypothetical protein [Hyphomicrobium sp.]